MGTSIHAKESQFAAVIDKVTRRNGLMPRHVVLGDQIKWQFFASMTGIFLPYRLACMLLRYLT